MEKEKKSYFDFRFGFILIFFLFCVFFITYYTVDYLQNRMFQKYLQQNEKSIPQKNSINFWQVKYLQKKCKISEDWARQILHEVGRYSHGRVLLAIAITESHLKLEKHSETAWGLMGINPKIWIQELTTMGIIKQPEDLLDLNGAFAAGNYVFTLYLQKADHDLDKALRFYVNGPYNKVKTTYPDKVRKVLGQLLIESGN